MAKRYKVEITEAQLLAIINIASDIDSMIGCASPDENGVNADTSWMKDIKLIDRFLNKNGFKR